MEYQDSTTFPRPTSPGEFSFYAKIAESLIDGRLVLTSRPGSSNSEGCIAVCWGVSRYLSTETANKPEAPTMQHFVKLGVGYFESVLI